MATLTLGTNTTTSLTSIKFANSGAGIAPADFATINQGIKDDLINGRPIYPGAFERNGILHVPNRGFLKVRPGDFVGVDPVTGWPILISADTAANGSWTHS